MLVKKRKRQPNPNKPIAVEMKLSGMTYADIGAAMGVSRQRAQQLVKPTSEVIQYVIERSGFSCEQCRAELGTSGHVHHAEILNPAEYNEPGNLQYLCISCHKLRHVKPADPNRKPANTGEKNPAAVALGRLGGSKKSDAKTAACRLNASLPRPNRLSKLSFRIITIT